ncbi:unnamed protein product [Brassica rapa]|uniref:Uncharacterized protein n=1 Tax=Brassica campestris TaxID=3711 RepID=A0A3P5ZU63_BRACM|nr:unnamed protein product [Brassica rapa]VDC75940.1 unnamed protein product [Brassica rapa]
MPTMVLGEGPVMAFELRRWFLWYLHLRYHQSLTDKEKEVWITDKALTVVLVLRRRRFKLRYFGVDEYRSHAGLNLQGLCKSWVGIGQHFYGQHPTRACTAKTRIDRPSPHEFRPSFFFTLLRQIEVDTDVEIPPPPTQSSQPRKQSSFGSGSVSKSKKTMIQSSISDGIASSSKASQGRKKLLLLQYVEEESLPSRFQTIERRTFSRQT